MPDLPLRPPGRGPTAVAVRRHRGRLDLHKDALAIASRDRRRTSMAGFAIGEDDALREGPRAARPPPLVGSSACRLRSPH
jgi:hypothetical protein